MVILYSNGCTNCKALKKRLDALKIAYEEVNDMEVFKEKGFDFMPNLEIDGKIYSFIESIKLINRGELNV